MVSTAPSVRKPPRHSKRFPLDYLGAAALVWAGAFLILAFVLGYLLR